MICYLLAQAKNVHFTLRTVNQVNPPDDFRDKNRAKIYPFVEGINGTDTKGQSIAGVMPESTDRTDDFFDSVNFDCPYLKRPKNLKDCILGKIDSISTSFDNLLKENASVTNILQRVEDHLAASGTTFLEGETLSYTDCFLLPWLQHITVAGKLFRDYEIPANLLNLWRYLRNAYETLAFRKTLPTDADLCKFDWERLEVKVQTELREKGKLMDKFVDEQPDKMTTTIPTKVAEVLDERATNGDGRARIGVGRSVATDR